MTEKRIGRRDFMKTTGVAGLAAGGMILGGATQAGAAKKKAIPKTPIKVAAISFLSGPAAGPFGIPAIIHTR